MTTGGGHTRGLECTQGFGLCTQDLELFSSPRIWSCSPRIWSCEPRVWSDWTMCSSSGTIFIWTHKFRRSICCSSTIQLLLFPIKNDFLVASRVWSCAPRVWTRFIRKSLTLGLIYQELIAKYEKLCFFLQTSAKTQGTDLATCFYFIYIKRSTLNFSNIVKFYGFLKLNQSCIPRIHSKPWVHNSNPRAHCSKPWVHYSKPWVHSSKPWMCLGVPQPTYHEKCHSPIHVTSNFLIYYTFIYIFLQKSPIYDCTFCHHDFSF